MIPINLYGHQSKMIQSSREAFRRSRNVLLQSATGSGKTVMGSYMLNSVVENNQASFFIVHRKELVDQTAKTFEKYGLPYGYIASGYPVNYYQPIQICSIDTLKNRIDKIPIVPKLVIWDEAHHVAAEGWTKVHQKLPHSYHLGLTATPERLDGKGLGTIFNELVLGPETSWLIDNGYLAQYKLFSVAGVDRASISSGFGDFNLTEAAKAMMRGDIIGDIIKHWVKKANGRPTIGFASTVEQSKDLVARFNAAGIPSAHLDATSKGERRTVLRDLATGKLKVVFNVGLFAEGFDIAANSGIDVTIGCIIDAAPTQSLGKWLQKCGRALRKNDDHGIILDHAGNWVTHGSPCEHREWSLDGGAAKKRKEKEDDNNIKVIQCAKCYYCFAAPAKSCPECGAVIEKKVRKIGEIDIPLEEVDLTAQREQSKKEQGQARSTKELIELETKRGYKIGYATHIQKARTEKKALQNKLLNLTIAARSIGIQTLSNREILELKPKALKESILIYENQIRVAE